MSPFVNGLQGGAGGRTEQSWIPAANVWETANEILGDDIGR